MNKIGNARTEFEILEEAFQKLSQENDSRFLRIKQLEADRKEVSDLSHTIALTNIDDRLVDPINRLTELSKALEGK